MSCALAQFKAEVPQADPKEDRTSQDRGEAERWPGGEPTDGNGPVEPKPDRGPTDEAKAGGRANQPGLDDC